MEEFAVLVVDRDEASREATADLVRSEISDAAVTTRDSRASAERALESETFDVLVTGYELPDGNGLELVKTVRSVSPTTTCLLYTYSETIDTGSFEEVIVDFVGKEGPDAEETLLALIEEADETLSQASHPVPDDEENRIEALERYRPDADDDLTPFRRIVDLAQTHFEASSVALTLIERHEQTVLASTGGAVTPSKRDESLSTHVLTQPNGTMAVGNTRVDPRFADIGTIQSAGIVAYLGARLTTPGDAAVGVLSVYDDESREFDAADHGYVRTLANLAVDVLLLGERAAAREHAAKEG
jgi:CheY-like chemotaxis protein